MLRATREIKKEKVTSAKKKQEGGSGERLFPRQAMNNTIHIAGSMPRIGTTTLALQMVRFCTKYGYKACYVEMSRQDYLWGVSNIYEGAVTNRNKGCTDYAGLSLYAGERLDALMDDQESPYDFIICDFGNVTDAGFSPERFAGGDCGIIVCGNKPNEIFKAEDALRNPMLSDAAVVLNFTEPVDYDAILEMMGERGEQTSFMPYVPDPFYNGEDYKIREFFQELMDNVVVIIQGEQE